MADEPPIARRKADHLEVAASGRADFAERTTLLDAVHLVHQSLPELALDEIDLSTPLFGKTLRAPVVVTGMTGGTPEAGRINRDLAIAAQACGVALGVGSQRVMAEHPELASTFQIRDVAPDVLLIGNLGAVQAAAMGAARVAELAKVIGADALAIHLNPAQELVQADGDRDFRGVVRTIGALVDELDLPILVKETGCGLSPTAARQLAGVGVEYVDVSGAGGTSWTAVEANRALAGSAAADLGRELWDWGLPTAVSVVACARAGLRPIASGGIRSGLDIARALALGAIAGGMAAPVLRAQRAGGEPGVRELLQRTIASLRAIHLLAGARTPAALAASPRHLGAPLRAWLADLDLAADPAP
jgi:isopentenyl-diphosphate Delta-isomerase